MKIQQKLPVGPALSSTINPNIVLLSRRLYSPNYEGPGKWVLYDVAARRAQLAISRQADNADCALPGVIEALLQASVNTDEVPDTVRYQLTSAGLLTSESEVAPSSFVQRLLLSVFDYPFFDYSSPKAFDDDEKLMGTYLLGEPPPPTWTERTGKRVRLPGSRLERQRTSNATLTLPVLADLLYFALSATEAFPKSEIGNHVRKTSPSGGAKHPTEAWVGLPHEWEGLEAGWWAYCGDTHELAYLPGEPAPTGAGPVLSMRSRVERAMWRYRDPRSFRAIAIDAGHVVETIAMRAGLADLTVTICDGSLMHGSPRAFVAEPEMCFLTFDRTVKRDQNAQTEFGELLKPWRRTDLSQKWMTNPTLSMTIDGGCLHGSTVLPKRSRVMSRNLFLALTHCLPSHRGNAVRIGDRDVSSAGVFAAVPDLSADEFNAAVEAGLFLEHTDATVGLLAEVRRWSDHGWYLPLLAVLEAAQAPRSPGVITATQRPGEQDAVNALLNRVTTRTFRRRSISADVLRDVVSDSMRANGTRECVEVYVAASAVDGFPSDSLLSWNERGTSFNDLGRRVSRNDIVDVTIGQGWVKNAAAGVWLLAHADPEEPASMLAVGVRLGRIAQRICRNATAKDFGVFTTPAVKDLSLAKLLGREPSHNALAYFVSIGVRP